MQNQTSYKKLWILFSKLNVCLCLWDWKAVGSNPGLSYTHCSPWRGQKQGTKHAQVCENYWDSNASIKSILGVECEITFIAWTTASGFCPGGRQVPVGDSFALWIRTAFWRNRGDVGVGGRKHSRSQLDDGNQPSSRLILCLAWAPHEILKYLLLFGSTGKSCSPP